MPRSTARFPAPAGALEGSYRFYTDTYGIVAHTCGPLLDPASRRQGGSCSPRRASTAQSAARFYYYNLDDTPIVPVRMPNGTAPYYSSDFRLSAEDTYSYGLKATWKAGEWVQFDAAYEEYVIQGRDGVTPASAYPRAGITTVGVKFLW